MKWRNHWVKISLCIHTEKWQAWISPGGVPFISSCFIYFLGNTSNGRIKCPVGVKQVTTVTRNPRSAYWTEDIWRLLSILIFSFVCAEQQWCLFCRNLKSCRIILNGVHSGFTGLKILSYWFKIEIPRSWEWRTSVFVTEISLWRSRKIFNHTLPVF